MEARDLSFEDSLCDHCGTEPCECVQEPYPLDDEGDESGDYEYLFQQQEETNHDGGSESVREPANTPTGRELGPTLAENEEEATRMLYAGRSSVALRESKIFDKERLANSPLFKEQGRLF